MPWHFETDCINSDGESITKMVDAAKPVSFRTMSRILGESFKLRQKELNYEPVFQCEPMACPPAPPVPLRPQTGSCRHR